MPQRETNPSHWPQAGIRSVLAVVLIGLCVAAWATVFSPAPNPAPPLPPPLARIEAYEHSNGPYHDVTLTGAEANAYFQGSGASSLPAGVSSPHFAFQPGRMLGSATVNFDEMAAGTHPSAMLRYLFAGTHRVEAWARLDSGQAPLARFTVTQVQMDGVTIPNALIDAAIEAFVRPKHPGAGRTFAVKLPRHATGISLISGAVVVHYPGGDGPR